MGFSWSSCVAQDCTLGLVDRAGLDPRFVICDSHELPASHAELAVVATDDVIFLHGSVDTGRKRLEAFDATLAAHQVPRAIKKDIDLADTTIGLGCCLRGNPPRVDADVNKLWSFLLGIMGLCTSQRASPGAVSSLLGLGQWFAVLCRPSFSAFHRCYRFARREPQEEVCDVPTAVVGELLSFALLAPLLGGALDAEWAPLLVASDAAPDFGFGVSVASLPSDEVRLLGLKSERRGDYVRFDRLTNKLLEPERPRVGRRVPLPVSATAFRDVISKRAEIREHSGILELRGVRLAVRWALWSARWFGRRLLLLVDAKAAPCAVAKGRSGAFSFRRPLASIGAHALASGCQLRCLYIPSEDNTADAPSRGKRRRPSRKRILKQRQHCKADRGSATDAAGRGCPT